MKLRRLPAGLFALTLACGSEPGGGTGDEGISGLTEGTTPTDDEAGGDGDGDGDGSGKLDLGPDSDVGSDGELECDDVLVAVVRDFQIAHPDFESGSGVDPGIVEFMLGPDDKPVYAGNPTTPTTNGQEHFDQWYRDVPGVNMSFEVEIPLTDNGDGSYTYANPAFFPIDDQGFGNEGNGHNYHFTLELHGEFTYEGGEVFEFTGDDDLFTFVNGRLGIDLGGVHGPLNGVIDMDAMAATLEIEVGETYSLDFFFAERHTSQSNFRIDTSIACLSVPPIG